jgi:hypothetical protein
VPGLRPPDEERIPVAAPRPPRHEHPRRSGVVDASGAGLIALVITAAFAALGEWLGSLIGIPIAGALILGFTGLLVGFAGIYWRYREL